MTRSLDTLTESDVAGVRAHSGHCASCKVRQFPCSGKCACVDGADVIFHQAEGYCPHPDGPLFGNGRMPIGWKCRGLGDALKKVLDLPGVNKIVAAVKPAGCGCGERQKALNAAVPFTRPES